MIQIYSNGLSVAAGATIPLNSIVYFKGNSATHSAPATIELNKRGVYSVKVDAYGAPTAVGDFGVQITVNGIPRADAINQTAVETAGNYGSASTSCLVTVAQSDCPCNCTSSPTTISIINPTVTAADDAHYNVTVTKIC